MPFLFFVLICMAVFTGIILFLVALLTIFEAVVVKPGPCDLTLNDAAKPIRVSTGDNLLKVLGANNIFLPAACGGEGKCGLCKCRVTEGGGEPLLTEVGHLTREQKKEHYRLACQVKIRGDIKVQVPEEVFNIKKFECTVRSNRSVATFIKELVLELPAGQALVFKAGGYIQIDIPRYNIAFLGFDIPGQFRTDWDNFKLWGLKSRNEEPLFRAYSMASHPAENGIVMLNVRIATPPAQKMSLPPGKSSSYIFNLKPGDKVTISGPYGEFFIKENSRREMIYIGGGAGMAPMRSHLFHLFRTLKTDRKVSFWYGARSRREMFYTEDFAAIEKEFPNFKYNVALSDALPEDKWTGMTGFIHNALYENYLKNHPEPEECEYYLCGPPMMIEAVTKMLDSLGVPRKMIAFDSFG
ncbi:MAG: NADH:ubiquinone reductase (Na(+)-transporting) subunit F [Candidatus Omnitrophica bacterium]|nr:NADH:ubiquinone reductase (Na(+)-transporting) subunit F [Candidatus Omnitrophota bacterium]